MDTNDYVIGIRRRLHWQVEKHDANQLDGKQRHTGFDYYEYNMPKFCTPSWAPSWAQSLLDQSGLNFQEHLEDFEHYQACH